MIGVVIAGAVLGALVVLGVVVAVRRRRVQTVGREAINVAVYREQQAELQQALARGDLDQAAYDAAHSDLNRRLVHEAEGVEAELDTQALGRPAALLMGLIVVLMVPAMFVLSQGQQHFPAPAEPQPSLEAMVASLAERMDSAPDDLDGWVLLGRSYTVMQRFQDAAQAYRRANGITDGGVPDLLVAEAEALAMAHDRQLQGRPAELIEQALAIDPTHVRGRWYAAMAAEQRGDDDRMREHMRELDGRPDLPPELQAVISEQLGTTTLAAATSADGEIAIDVSVVLDQELLDEVPDGAVLFVYAKAQSGPPMPLAVQRLEPADWPRQVRLTEAMAMMPGMTLGKFDAWTVGARLSSSGRPIAQAGDLQGEIGVTPDMLDAPVTVTIADVVGAN